MKKNKKQPKQEQETQELLITNFSPHSPLAESYRTLRTNVGFAAARTNSRSIMSTSCNPEDGKSTILSNLAISFALAGHKTVLLDCDLRRPVIHRLFGISNKVGVSNCLQEKVTIEEVGCRDYLENLTVVTSGPVLLNPSEILANEYTHAFIKAITSEYDYVFIDAPPVLSVADAMLIASHVDGVILVLTATETKTKMAKEAKLQLNKANANILGIVLNKISKDNRLFEDTYYAYTYSSEKS